VATEGTGAMEDTEVMGDTADMEATEDTVRIIIILYFSYYHHNAPHMTIFALKFIHFNISQEDTANHHANHYNPGISL